MKMDKIEKYYKLKQDIEKVDKFVSEYFISQERKDKKVNSSFSTTKNVLRVFQFVSKCFSRVSLMNNNIKKLGRLEFFDYICRSFHKKTCL